MPFICGKHELATLPQLEPLELWTETAFFASWTLACGSNGKLTQMSCQLQSIQSLGFSLQAHFCVLPFTF